MSRRAKDHHSVPRDYLRQWSDDGLRVSSYRTLVPHARYPEWKHRAIRSLTMYEELYTSISSGTESDRFERWMNEAIETPAAGALERVSLDQRLTREHWHALVRYVALLDLRTPVSYMEFFDRSSRGLPEVLTETLARVERDLQRAAKKGRRLPDPPSVTEADERFPLKVSVTKDQESDRVELKAEITIGRELWLHNMRRAVLKTSEMLHRHSWVIFKPHPGSEWFTSDHPVLRLNFVNENNYNFGGGWGRRNCEIVMPLSPQHLLYTKIGDRDIRNATLSREHTNLFQKLIAERAHRWIIAQGVSQSVSWWRPRVVDVAAYKGEAETWRRWHAEQTAGEVSKPRPTG
jgi:hypothetical protein